MRRKNIALLTSQPEAAHEVRIINGIATQCKKYGYHFSVFSPITHLEISRTSYVEAEANIYNLLNLDKIDGLILDAVNLMVKNGKIVLDTLLDRLQAYPDLPVVSLEMTIGDLPLIMNKNEKALREMCRHAIDVHGKHDLCILTGQRGNEVAESRLGVCLDEIKKHGIAVSDEHIVYGDFWYSSGDALALKIANGEISRPEAVLCTSTHMALGLIYRLQKCGIRVPEDVIVIGFDTTNEGCCNDIVLSAYDAADAYSAAAAVDYIRNIIEPGEEILPFHADAKDMFYPGMSCGCSPDIHTTIKAFRRTAYLVAYNSSSDNDISEISFGRLMESYCLEELTSTASPEECFIQMGKKIYLLHPFRNYFLCLKPDWLEESVVCRTGYPSEMMLALSAWETPDHQTRYDVTPVRFNTADMIPMLDDETTEPSIFYFTPVHFEGITFGYSVIRRSLDDICTLSLVYRTWIRFVNNALEMTRTRNSLMSMSIHDSMTGLLNRRGMSHHLEKKLAEATEKDKLFVAVIDMNGLKKINDTYGHSEGDYAIAAISTAVKQVTKAGEICVRAGGDEFYIMGVGRYKDEDTDLRRKEFTDALKELLSKDNKPYDVTASIGCVIEKIDANIKIDTVISRADEEMYKEKSLVKKQS